MGRAPLRTKFVKGEKCGNIRGSTLPMSPYPPNPGVSGADDNIWEGERSSNHFSRHETVLNYTLFEFPSLNPSSMEATRSGQVLPGSRRPETGSRSQIWESVLDRQDVGTMMIGMYHDLDSKDTT